VTGQIAGGVLIAANLAGWLAGLGLPGREPARCGRVRPGGTARGRPGWLAAGECRRPGPPPVAWALLTLMLTTGTYLAPLFTLAQYLQAGLGRSPVVSGLTLISWVAAFGLAGRLAGRLPERLRPGLPVADPNR
jgi:hypothetical protein